MSSSSWTIISVPGSSNLQNIIEEEVEKLQLEDNEENVKSTSVINKHEKYHVDEETSIHLNDINTTNDLVSDAVIAKLLQQEFNKENVLHRKYAVNKKLQLQIPIVFNNNEGLQYLKEEVEELQIEENVKSTSVVNKHGKYHVDEETSIHLNDANTTNDLASDVVIAKLLQQEFNKENVLHRKYAANKKLQIPIVFSNNNEGLQCLNVEDEFEEILEDFPTDNDWDQSDTTKKEINKHDISFYNKHLSDSELHKIKNSLKVNQELHQSILNLKLDEYSSLQLHKMIKNRILKKVNDVIKIDKDIVLLRGEYYSSYPESKECLLKVAIVPSIERKCKRNLILKRNIILSVEREMKNFFRSKEAGMCPESIDIKNNILIMSFTEKNLDSAQILENTDLEVDENILAYKQIVEGMNILFNKNKLVYGNLSESNILWLNNKCYVIDTSEIVEVHRGEAFSYLMMDCKSITKFFCKKVPDIMAPEELFTEITGLDYKNKKSFDDFITTLTTEPHLMNSANR